MFLVAVVMYDDVYMLMPRLLLKLIFRFARLLHSHTESAFSGLNSNEECIVQSSKFQEYGEVEFYCQSVAYPKHGFARG